MSVSGGQGRLGKAAKDLQADFAELRRYWNDDVADRFEREHLAPMILAARTSIEAMGHIEQVLQSLIRDCE